MFKLNAVTESMKFHLTMVSSNVKTGPIPVSTSSRETCSPICPFFDNGCYAESGPLRIHWEAVTHNMRGYSFDVFCEVISTLPDGQLWRLNQAGDLPHVGGYIDHGAMLTLCEANTGLKGFTYTHHDIDLGDNLSIIEQCNVAGFTVNLSANDLEHADTLYRTGLPVCVVLPITQDINTYTPNGVKVVVCPSAIRENVSCMTCGLCQISYRNVIIGFPSHGPGAKKANAIASRIIPIKAI